MRVAVTGATGFLGSEVCRRLAELGHQVVALGRNREKLATLRCAQTVALDLAAAEDAPRIEADAMVHCAALSSPWGREIEFLRANVTGTQTALALARCAGVRRFVQISTPSVYFRFRDQLALREDTPLPRPINAYARTKRVAENLALAATELDPIVLRPRGLYGAGDANLLPRVLAAARRRPLPLLNGGRAVTDLTHVADAAEAACAAALAGPTPQRVFNISGGEALNMREAAERAGARAGVVIRWRPLPAPVVLGLARAGETAAALLPHHPEPVVTAYGVGLFAFSQTLDISAARDHLGWRPSIPFEQGLDLAFADHAA